MSLEDEITALDALPLSAAIHARAVSCREVMAAYLARIHAVNPRLNALVNLRPDEALLVEATGCDAELARGHSRGWMHGLPQAIKDTAHAAGLPTTFGCTLLQDAVADQDSLHVARMKGAGAIVIAKTNMPEFGLGSHTYNRLFGVTPNAWDAGVSAGGSSGGSAVALAARLLPVADGSDYMGSLRNPAGWNHVFGLRPSPGRVPAWPKPELFVSQLGTDGPMARTVADLAALLGTQAGWDARAPLALAQAPGVDFTPTREGRMRGLRIGWLGDLGGHLAMEAGVLEVCAQALARMASAGAQVEPTALGFDADRLWRAWLIWRHALVAPTVAAVLAQPGARQHIKPEALWEHDQAQGVSVTEFMAAARVRSAFHAQVLTLLERFDVLALPVAQVWPFPIEQAWPRAIGERVMDTYHRWMEVTLYATFAGLPAMSVPAGFHANGRWPMGLQLIGPPLGDAAVLEVARGCELISAELLARRPDTPPPAPALMPGPVPNPVA